MKEYYAGSGFLNAGYWASNPPNQVKACEALIDHLIGFMPSVQGNILDVACGNGATTRSLQRYYPADQITGINISEFQLAQARVNAPGSTFYLMDAVDLQFEDASFDAIICVEAAFHFRTRRDFLAEALRVLKPNGYLLLADLIYWTEDSAESFSPDNFIVPDSNMVRDLDAYRTMFADVGYTNVTLEDATFDSWIRYQKNFHRWLLVKQVVGDLDDADRARLTNNPYQLDTTFMCYPLLAAQKP